MSPWCSNLFKLQSWFAMEMRKIISACCHVVCLLSDCIHLSTAQWLCASRMTSTATRSATLAQIAVLTSWWEVTFGSGMWCTVRSTPKRGTRAKQLPLEPPCPIANESAAPHLPRSGRRVLLVCLKLHLIRLSYRLWDGAWRWTLVDHMTQDVLFRSHLTILCNIMIHFFFCLSYNCMRSGALFFIWLSLHSL